MNTKKRFSAPLFLGLVFVVAAFTPAWADDAKPDASPSPSPSASPAPSESPAASKPSGQDQTTKSFTGEALAIKKLMVSLFEASQKVGKSTGEGSRARATIEGAFDWERISRECLGNAQWKKTSESNREQFSKLLKEVATKTAYGRMATFWDGTTFRFDKINITGAEALVKCRFHLNDETFDLEYSLDKQGTRWLVHDIAFDDIRYSENINEQITSFLREGNFAGLLDKLRKRRDEVERDQKDKAAEGKKKK